MSTREKRKPLDQYIEHAERFGTEEVFETAVDAGEGARVLGPLARRLRNLDPKWKLSRYEQFLLINVLRGTTESAPQIALAVGLTVPVVRRVPYLVDEDPNVALRRAVRGRFEPTRPPGLRT